MASPAAAVVPASISSVRLAAAMVAGRTSRALGTFCSLLVTRPAVIGEAQRILSAELEAVDLACSRFRPDSELAALNRAGGRELTVSPLLAEAISVALRAAEITDGDVDPTCGRSLVRLGYDRDFAELAGDTSPLPLPPAPAAGWRSVRFDPARRAVQLPDGVMLDLGATAKALAADRAAAAITAAVAGGALVNLGGDIAVAGSPPEGGWRVGIDDGVATPDDAHGGPVVAIRGGGLATSCPGVRTWRRGGRQLHHILVPATGQPAESCWAAVSVAAATCVDANIASTAAVIRGAAGPAWLNRMELPARLARADGTVVTTAGWPG